MAVWQLKNKTKAATTISPIYTGASLGRMKSEDTQCSNKYELLEYAVYKVPVRITELKS